MTPHEELATAIVIRAVKDYKRALRKLKRQKDDIDASSTVHEVERFFRSKWFTDLCDLDGEKIIDRLKGEVYDCKRVSRKSKKAGSENKQPHRGGGAAPGDGHEFAVSQLGA